MTPKHGKKFSSDLRVTAHGERIIASNLAEAKEKIKRKGWTRGTIQKVNSYLPLDSAGNESMNLPMVWIDQGDPRPFSVGSRGGFKWVHDLRRSR